MLWCYGDMVTKSFFQKKIAAWCIFHGNASVHCVLVSRKCFLFDMLEWRLPMDLFKILPRGKILLGLSGALY